MVQAVSTDHWLNQIVASPTIRAVRKQLSETDRVVLGGSYGSSSTLAAGAISIHCNRPVLYVVAHLDEADEAVEDLRLFQEAGMPLDISHFPALEMLPGESNVNLDLLAQRLAVVNSLTSEHNTPGPTRHAIVAPIQALMQAVPRPSAMDLYQVTIEAGKQMPPAQLFDWLDRCGYQRTDAIEEPGDFASRGGIIDIFPPGGTSGHEGQLGAVRLDYFGDEVESIRYINTETMGSFGDLQRIQIIGASAQQLQADDQTTHFSTLLPANTLVVMHELMELSEQARGYYERLTDPCGIYSPQSVFQHLTRSSHIEINQYSTKSNEDPAISLPIHPLPSFENNAAEAVQQMAQHSMAADAPRLIVLCQKPAERDRLRQLIKEHAPASINSIEIEIGYLHRGFSWSSPIPTEDSENNIAPSNAQSINLTLVPNHELFHRYETRRQLLRPSGHATAAKQTDAFVELEAGDHVVHIEHGIARFSGLKAMTRRGKTQDYLTLEFAGKTLLHIPAEQIDLVQKYVGGFGGKPPLSLIGGKRWAKQKEAVAEAVKNLASELLRIQAARTSLPGLRFPPDTAWQQKFEAEFPYEDTHDQIAATAQVKRDMAHGQPMDRLICGDVGFGKTEIAIRAAFKAIEYGKQVAVLVPTTVLAEQHARTFSERMADYPFRIESLSRFKTGKEQMAILQDIDQGRIDITVGTHRLLSKDVQFSDLGLVIVDEEQRFGVEHKQRLLEFRLTADVLTLTATPIPRTLHMAMLGLRDISSLSTPPLDRRAIVTEVIPYDERRIKQAILRELNRDGQVFFVHNRVYNIQAVANNIRRLVPHAKVIVGHGQMPAPKLEQVMQQIVERKADILVSTTIIESGIDIPLANTIFINMADHFGLADLHQLRGRVGRYKHRAYCYLLLPANRPISDTSARRLKAIEQYSMLGAGFKIAMRDLEIRGAGNLLGAEQSGHIATVGYELYCTLLEKATKRLQNQPIIEPLRTHMDLPTAGRLNHSYIPSDRCRMEAYRRLSRAATLDELEAVAENLTDAYGQPTRHAQALIDLTELRIAASTCGIESLKLDGEDLIFKTTKLKTIEQRLAQAPGRTTVVDHHTVYYRPPAKYLEPQTLMRVLRKIFVYPLAKNDPPSTGDGKD
ncbi:MAG: transcription-repair coupling factor [Phycisphaeraceae bacterium]|nr:transcription-repair coupling factor [Phycisphaeraceae bacterium]